MKFGVREICNVVFKAKARQTIGDATFEIGQPVLYIDTAKTSTVEGAATTVYAQGGVGNTRLIAWEGEKTLTFTVEDALLSPIGFSVLSGAGLFKGLSSTEKVHVHTTAQAQMSIAAVQDGGTTKDVITIDLSDALATGEGIDDTAPVFVMLMKHDSITGTLVKNLTATTKTGGSAKVVLTGDAPENFEGETGDIVFVDFYVVKDATTVSELQIDAANFGGYYYVEASTLFRRQSDGVDLPAELTFPNVKIQSNFTFTMAPTGDPSTFTFTMDAFPGKTYFEPTKSVLCVMQIVEDGSAATADIKSVMKHTDDENIDLDSANQDSIGG